MLKRLKISLKTSEGEKFLQKYQINKQHTQIPLRAYSEIVTLAKAKKFREQITKCLDDKLKLENSTVKVKALTLIHACIRTTFDEGMCGIINGRNIPHQNEHSKKLKLKLLETVEIKNYMEMHVFRFYLTYLKKIIAYQESYEFVRDYSQRKSYPIIEIINHGFKIINLMNSVLESQEIFNKMGRYYLGFRELFNMFIMILRDVDFYNMYIKKTIKKFLKKEKGKTQLEDLKVLLDEKAEETKHIFLYVCQAQKTSDQLHQFYYNRYYYKEAKALFSFPTFLSLEVKQYDQIKHETKKVDRHLVESVKKSKFRESSSLSKKIVTEPNLNKTFTNGLRNTQYTEQGKNHSNPYHNITFDFGEKMEEVYEEDDVE